MPRKKTQPINLYRQSSSTTKSLLGISDIAGTAICAFLLMATIREYEGNIFAGNSVV
jgi:hypothetical protein